MRLFIPTRSTGNRHFFKCCLNWPWLMSTIRWLYVTFKEYPATSLKSLGMSLSSMSSTDFWCTIGGRLCLKFVTFLNPRDLYVFASLVSTQGVCDWNCRGLTFYHIFIYLFIYLFIHSYIYLLVIYRLFFFFFGGGAFNVH